jgi:exosome complex component CSL4
MARMASADIMCVDSKAVKEKFTGMIRYGFCFLC